MFDLKKNLLVGAIKTCLASVVISMLVTTAATILIMGNAPEFWLCLVLGLVISAIVPIFVAFPVTYYILQQRDVMKTLNEELAFLVKYDPLTSLLTRRAFFQEAENSLKQVHARELSGAFCFMDLDHFKKVNDTFGHSVGDEVLRIFGKVIKECLQTGEIAGRLGGEEFGVFLPNCTAEQSYEKAQKIVDEFKHQARIVNGKPVSCTLSIGVAATYPSDDFDQLLNAADRMLYLAKERGRDCVVRQTKRDSENRIAA